MKSLMNSFVGKIIVMIIIAGMAFWGVDQMFAQLRGGIGSNMAAAGSRGFDAVTFDRRVESVIRNINADSEEPVTKPELLEQGVIDQVFQLEAAKLTLLGYADSIGVHPSTDAVVEELKNIDAFKNPLTGALDLDTYRDVLYRSRITQADYEQQLSDDLTMKALRDAAGAAIFPPKTLSGLQARYIGEARNVGWFILDTSSLPEPDAPTEDEIRAYYDENLEALKQPERRMIDVLRMSAEDFLSEVTVTDQEVATVYEASKSERYSEPDTRTYVELMFSSREAARTAFGLLAAGADPASVEGVASRETRTGRRESVSDPLLAEAMFGAGKQSGALFGPAERGDQWLVARLVSVQPGAVFPLEQVEGEIRDQLSRERAAVLLFEKMEALDRAIGAGYPIGQIAEEVGVPLITFAPVDQSGRTREGVALMGLISAGEAFQQAFEIPVGETSNRIDIGEATYLTSPRKVLESYTPEFEELREDVRTGLVRQREANGVQAALDDLTDRIKSGESTLEAEARAANEVVETPLAPITRRTAADSGLPNAAVTSVFSGKEGDVFTFPSRTGDAVMVMQITDITPPSEADMSELAPLANSSLLTSLQTDLDQAMEAEIAATMKLRTNQGTLRAYKATITSDQ
ncbi:MULTISPECIES: peptidylprolyl isomerase [unclassified Hyphomonas]|uniref:peptidylprolyl isomerase n=1 Tax=unclassified Hyphomonas TaxID=2630699 RepID=UPI0025B8EF2D|nr:MULTISPECIES: peptidylprolyl isomerase [unclassified Hyphomonas]|tara:strand:+ start:1442 stop:3343 length:1902 start_codon:yes stop_codon:yes gene_type:complete